MLETLPPLARFVFRGNPAALGVPATPLRATRQGERIALWQGPDEWLLLQPEAAPAPQVLAGALVDVSLHGGRLRRAGEPQVLAGALVDVSHRQIALALHGVEAEIRLNAACPLDLSEAAFPVDMTTRTMFAKADITLWRTAPDRFHIEVARSFADYVVGILQLSV